MLVVAQAAKISKLYKKFTPRQYIAAGVIVLALGVMLAIGFMIGRNSAAAAVRDCGETSGGLNSIANNADSGGGCGALSPSELITDINNGDPDDQAGVMAAFGLPSGKYDEFKNHAKMGVAKTNGDIEVDGDVVMTGAWSIGRVNFNYSQPFAIDGVGNYFRSAHTDVLKQNIPVMVMFDGDGTVEAAVLTSCGNPVKGEKVKSSAKCKKLIKTPVKDKENTFSFTTEVATTGLAEIEKVEYFADGELFGSKTNPETPVIKTFTEDTTVVAKVTVRLPGGKKKVVESELCKQQIEVKKKEVQPPTVVTSKPEQPKVLPAKVVEEQPLPVTGPEGAATLFVGTSLAGAIGHHLYRVLRHRKQR